MNLNKVILIGRIASDINLYESKYGVNVVRFSLAINRDNFTNNEDITDFIPLVAFRNNATFISNFFNKGDLINIVGSLQSSQYTTKNGDITNSLSVVIDQIKSLETKSAIQARVEKNNTTILNTNSNESSEKPSFYADNSSNEEPEKKDDNPWELDF